MALPDVRDQEAGEVVKLYYTNTLPAHWVVEDDEGQWWLMPVVSNGWLQRKPYIGPRAGLRRAECDFERLVLAVNAANEAFS